MMNVKDERWRRAVVLLPYVLALLAMLLVMFFAARAGAASDATPPRVVPVGGIGLATMFHGGTE